MAQEIERKFLLADDTWKSVAGEGAFYRQGYLISEPSKAVRIRVAKNKGFITIKSGIQGGGFARSEFEYEIPIDDANEILNTLCLPGKIEKTRYEIQYGDHLWEVDVFHGDNEGLVTAEIELLSEDELFEMPSWVGEDVTSDSRYKNGQLAQHPFADWDK